MQIFEPLKLKFEQDGVWATSPSLALIDTILEQHPELIKDLSKDVMKGCKNNHFGRGDKPSVEQIVRAAIYKEIKGLDYRELEFAQIDSRLCAAFLKIDTLRPYSFQVYQKYISKISAEKLEQFLYALNKIAINEGVEDVSRISEDSTVVESNIHYPTNNSLVWDCIHESHRLLTHLKEELDSLSFIDYTKSAKKTYYFINNTKTSSKKQDVEKKTLNKRQQLFKKQLVTFTKSINQVANIVKKKNDCINIKAYAIVLQLEELLSLMRQIYSVVERHEIYGEKIKNEEKIFSIYERHTDIIVKGSREVKFGHKIDLANGKSNLILVCDILKGNPADSSLYKPMIENLINVYNIVPRDSVTDGGYASKNNMEYAKSQGIKNIVFNKIVGSLKNIVSSKNMETRLKKWRSASEAIISNLKRGFNLFRCNWKGEAHFAQKVLWSVIAYNIRVFSSKMLATINLR
jgi:IS5 family transposase